nr:TetR/AcrR family transcriptional regulator [Nocardiopsis sp. MG754419]
MGRSTLHRYFADREELLAATFDEALSELGRVMEEARIDEGRAVEALRRVVAAHVEVGEWVVFAFGDPANEAYAPDDAEPEPALLVDLIRRGQAEGDLTADLDAVWVVNVLWALVFTGMEQVEAGRLSRHAVASTVIRTLEGGVLARP